MHFCIDLCLEDFVGRQEYVNLSPYSHQPFNMRVLFYMLHCSSYIHIPVDMQVFITEGIVHILCILETGVETCDEYLCIIMLSILNFYMRIYFTTRDYWTK